MVVPFSFILRIRLDYSFIDWFYWSPTVWASLIILDRGTAYGFIWLFSDAGRVYKSKHSNKREYTESFKLFTILTWNWFICVCFSPQVEWNREHKCEPINRTLETRSQLLKMRQVFYLFLTAFVEDTLLTALSEIWNSSTKRLYPALKTDQ